MLFYAVINFIPSKQEHGFLYANLKKKILNCSYVRFNSFETETYLVNDTISFSEIYMYSLEETSPAISCFSTLFKDSGSGQSSLHRIIVDNFTYWKLSLVYTNLYLRVWPQSLKTYRRPSLKKFIHVSCLSYLHI